MIYFEFLIHKSLVNFHYVVAILTGAQFLGIIKMAETRQEILFDVLQYKIGFP